ncbi:SUN domain-containing ossification factor [Armadillidium nasatum]|uniref:SUN domain-containing ossification factor n=1 Tax=Armadillidium nasatum TaxID=96803 RepID=A0A5N5STJ9_9CRUS|nr:SUN domain-containing ossification factor [Armadillidium nasatum]
MCVYPCALARFESVPHKGTYTDILKPTSEPVTHNESLSQLKDEEVSVSTQEIKKEGSEAPLAQNDTVIEEESHKILNKTEDEVAVDLTKDSKEEIPDVVAVDLTNDSGEKIADEVGVDLTKPSAEEIPETDVNTSTILAQKEILDEARKEKDQLETYSQFAERVSAEKKNGVCIICFNFLTLMALVKSKNYASTDCGAKFIAANPEASHSHKIINSNKDEYMLNKCTEKLWVVVELCESIKPQKFDIANFELFSNLPKEIQLYGSHRYPTREWVSLGTYEGEEGNRGTQSFHIDTQEFLKYIKLEIHSHYGTEFYCPLSQFRIYGMSEFEVIEEAEDTEEEPVIEEEEVEPEAKAENEKDKRGIMIPDVFKSIFNGVLEVIKRGSRSGNLTEESELIKYNETCKSLKEEFTIKNESCHFADSLNYILACYYDEYLKLMFNPFISQVVKNYDFCYRLATIICSSPQNNDSYVYDSICNNSYACVMLSPKHILAMCHMNNPLLLSDLIACETEEESNDAKNLSTIDSTIGKLPLDITIIDKGEKFIDIDKKLPSNERNTSSHSQKVTPPSQTNGLKIEPLSNNLDSDMPAEPPPDTKQNVKEEGKSARSTTVNKVENASSPVISEKPEKADKTEKQGDTKKDKKAEKTQEKNSSGSEDQGSPATTTTTTPPPTTAIPVSGTEGRVSSHSNKESVVVRLSNKIKVLEQNMSISSQYLEELSRRYKIQMEEMERQFNITIHALNRTSQIAYERDVYHQKRIEGLEEQVERLTNAVNTLVKDKDNFMKSVFEHHIILLIIQVLIITFAFTFCMKRVRAGLLAQDTHPSTPVASQIQNQDHVRKNNNIAICESEIQGRETSPQFRRMSADNLKTENIDKPKERRFSGQAALKGTYQDLLITEQNSTNAASNPKEKRRKKKKTQLQRSMSNVSIHESKDPSSTKEGKLDKLKKSSAGVLFSGEKIAQTSKSKAKSEVVGSQSVEDIRHEDWQLVKRNKSKKWKNELNSQQEEEPNYVFSSDLKRGKITVVEESFNNIYPHPYYAEILYDDYVYDKAYIEEEYKDYNDCDFESHVVATNGISDSINHVYAASEFDYNAPVINDYYHNARDSPSYSVVGDEIGNPYEHASNEDNHITLWNDNVLTKPIVKQLRNTSVPPSLKGKTRLRSDNWEWYSSQPSRLLPKSNSTEIISNSSSDSNGKPKQQQQQQQKQEIKSSKEKFEKKKRRKKSRLAVVNGENP